MLIIVEHDEKTGETSVQHNTSDEIASDILELAADLILSEPVNERILYRVK